LVVLYGQFMMHGQRNIKLSSTCFEQIIFHHQEVISVHAEYSNLPCLCGVSVANTMWLESVPITSCYRLDTHRCMVNCCILRVQK